MALIRLVTEQETPMKDSSKDSSKRTGLPGGMKAPELLDLYFLDIRSHLLEVAAGLDRIERGLISGSQASSKPWMS